MTDILAPEQRSLRMAAVRTVSTGPELIVRRLLHGAGFRYRLNARKLPGSPDIVLPKWNIAVFVHGCFWHGHDCSLFKLPATRTDWWRAKILSNMARDRRAIDGLVRDGWRVMVVWQCTLKGKGRLPPERLCALLSEGVRGGATVVEIRGISSRDPHGGVAAI
ncbi:very short patch repair endonuclease [Burkholderia sp. AU33545]|uniref:very short patch repair endonuclease n=1 Tax=Burkholderia sp. AU33545 TaxID=2879631 RepID=UPI001CF1C05A|nr:very short patch repair endonuclease [Burkholderia sp. AU33545]MCA8203106.1 very short patch repair endonuclease [Burkholderia sp. AU33545]